MRNDLVVDARVLERLLHAPARMPGELDPLVLAAVQLDGHEETSPLGCRSYDTPMRAVVLDERGAPRLADVPEPDGPGKLVDVLAVGLCGSDVEKLQPEFAGAVLGHEVVARTPDGRRVALVHHRACGECERCRAGHESTCEAFEAPTIRPGGFAQRANAQAWVDVPDAVDDARATAVEPLACVLRGAERVPRGRVLVVGFGFIGRLFAAVLERRGDEVFAVGVETAIDAVQPGGTILVFADAGPIPAAAIYRRELTLVGTRSATTQTMRAA